MANVYLPEIESGRERCFFTWKFEDLARALRRKTGIVGILRVSPGDPDRARTLWELELESIRLKNVNVYLRRLRSRSVATVFARCHIGFLDSRKQKRLLRNFSCAFDVGCTRRVLLLNSLALLEDESVFSEDGSFILLFEMLAQELRVEGYVLSAIRESLPNDLRILSDDMRKLLEDEIQADVTVRTRSELKKCHKAVLSARSPVLAEILKDPRYTSGDCCLDLDVPDPGILGDFLTCIYCGTVIFYMEHTIPSGLYNAAKMYGLRDLQQHLEASYSTSFSKLGSIDVTWKMPGFRNVASRTDASFFYPREDSEIFHDDPWRFKLQWLGIPGSVGIYVIRNQKGNSAQEVRFTVHAEYGKRINLKRTKTIQFQSDGMEGFDDFLSKEQLCQILSYDEDVLVLKCSLELTPCLHSEPDRSETSGKIRPSAIELFKMNLESSWRKLSQDLATLYESGLFSDLAISTPSKRFDLHSCMVGSRLRVYAPDLHSMLQSMDPHLTECFVKFVYGGRLEPENAFALQHIAAQHDNRHMMTKLSNFLSSCTMHPFYPPARKM